MSFLKNQAAVTSGEGGGYLNPSKIPSGGSARFALLAEEPLEFYEAWGVTDDGGSRPFRFASDPSPSDIEAEMGPDYTRKMNMDGTAPDPVKFGISVPVYNFESKSIQVLSLTQKSIIREIDQISQMEEYENLMEIDFILSKQGSGLKTEYTLRPVPRKTSQAVIDKTWDAALTAGFDITRMISGGNPFKEAA
jgi:hypothetical protein